MQTPWWRRLLQKIGSASQRERQPWTRTRLQIEALEDRLAPTIDLWIAPASGNWSVASNWSNGVPGAGDVALFDNAVMGGTNADATIDAAFAGSVSEIAILSYTGTITDSLANLNVGAGGYIQGAGTFTAGGNAVNTTNVTLAGGILNAPTSTGILNVSGDWSVTGGAFNADGGTVTFDGATVQTLNSGGASFNNINYSGTGSLRLTTSPLSVAGTLTTAAGAGNLDAATNNLGVSVAQLTTLTGGGFLAGSATVSFNGGLTINGGAFIGAAGTVNTTDVNLSSGTLNAPTANFNVSGIWDDTGGTFTANGGTVNFDGVGTQTITSGGASFDNVSLNGPTVQLLDPFNATGALAITSGTFDLDGQAASVASVTGAGIVTDSAAAANFTVAPAAPDSYAGTITGSTNLVDAGTSALTLTKANTYTGSTTINNGILRDGAANALPPGTNLTIDGTGNFDLNGKAQTVASLADGGVSTGTLTDTAASAIFTDATSGADSFSGLISGALALTMNGTGSLALGGVNTYTGATTITQGAISAAHVSSLGNAISAVILGGAATSGALSYTGPAATYTRGFTVSAGGGELDNSSASLLTVSTGAIVTTTGTFTVGGTGNITITSLIGPGSGGLTMNGSGTLTLGNAANTYTGQTTINSGTIRVGTLANGGSNSPLGATVAATPILLDTTTSATLSYTGPSVSTNRSIMTSAAGGIIQATNGAATLTLTGAINDAGTSLGFDTNSGNILVTGAISGAGGLAKTGIGVLTLGTTSTTETYGGGTNIFAGTVEIAGALSASSSATVLLLNAAVLDGAPTGVPTGQILRPVEVDRAAVGTVQISNLTIGVAGADGITLESPGAYSANISTDTVTNSVRGIVVGSTTGTDSISACTIANNTSVGIDVVTGAETVNLTNSTVSGNAGAGIAVDAGPVPPAFAGTLALEFDTVAANLGGGLNNLTGVASVVTSADSLYAGNTGFDYAGPGTSNGNNLVQATPSPTNDFTQPTDITGQAALLAPLANYGGPTQTQALLPGSAALGNGAAIVGVTTDQRGVARPNANGLFDIGAFESRGFTLTPTIPLTPAGDTYYRTLINQPFFDAAGSNPLNFGVTVTSLDPNLTNLSGGRIVFVTPPAGASATPAATTVVLGASNSATTTATANATASTPATPYFLYATTAPTPTYASPGPNAVGWMLFNQIVNTLSYAQTGVISAATKTNPVVITTSIPHGLVTGQQVTIAGVGGTANGAHVITVPGGAVAKATATTGNPIVITTSAAHGLVTGDTVAITGSTIAAANGAFTITVGSSTTFSLNGTSAASTGTFIGGAWVSTNTFSLNGVNGAANPVYVSGGTYTTGIQAPQNNKSGELNSGVAGAQGLQFKTGTSFLSTTLNVALLDQDTVPHRVDVTGQSVALQAIYGVTTGTINSAPSGTALVTTVAGIATFNNLQIYQSNTSYHLVASYPNSAAPSASAASSTFAILPYQMAVVAANFSQFQEQAFTITLATSTRGTIRLVNVSLGGTGGLQTNQALIEAFDYAGPGAMAQSTTYNGPITLAAVSGGVNVPIVGYHPPYTMTAGQLLISGITVNVLGAFNLYADTTVSDLAGMVDVNSKTNGQSGTFVRVNLGRQR